MGPPLGQGVKAEGAFPFLDAPQVARLEAYPPEGLAKGEARAPVHLALVFPVGVLGGVVEAAEAVLPPQGGPGPGGEDETFRVGEEKPPRFGVGAEGPGGAV